MSGGAGFTFYLGAPKVCWLARTEAPLFVSYLNLSLYKKLPRATCRWALDSGGFMELSKHGKWTIPAEEYAENVQRFAREVGRLDWAACQDWMCEPDVLRKTGLTVAEHQRRTVANYLTLRKLAPAIPWVPVLQGWTWGCYLDCIELYRANGIELASLPLVGLGSVCRRQETLRAGIFIRDFWEKGIKLHAFGFKIQGLRDCWRLLKSSDSQAWSFGARRKKRSGDDPEADPNSLPYALEWREHLFEQMEPAKPASAPPPPAVAEPRQRKFF